MASSIGDTYGAMLVGALMTMSVYGITTLQAYFYFLYYPKDSPGLKLLVTFIWTLDTLHVVFMCHAIYYYLVTSFGNSKALLDGTWSIYASMTVNIFMAFVIQCFYVKHIHLLSPRRIKWWLSSAIALFVLAHFCFGIDTVTQFFIKKSFGRLSEATYNGALPFATTAILSDILIAVALCVLLGSNRSEFEDTNNLINRLIVFAINRCILTSAVAVVEVIVFICRPHSFYTFAIDFIIGKLYTNSLLATLNSRQSFRGMGKDTKVSGTVVSTEFKLSSVVSTTDPRPANIVRMGSRESTAEGGPRPSDADSSKYYAGDDLKF